MLCKRSWWHTSRQPPQRRIKGEKVHLEEVLKEAATKAEAKAKEKAEKAAAKAAVAARSREAETEVPMDDDDSR